MKNNHMLWMILACAVPLLLIFMLPVFGIKSENTAFIAIVLMFGAHLLMMDGHGHDHEGRREEKEDKPKGEKHEHH